MFVMADFAFLLKEESKGKCDGYHYIFFMRYGIIQPDGLMGKLNQLEFGGDL